MPYPYPCLSGFPYSADCLHHGHHGPRTYGPRGDGPRGGPRGHGPPMLRTPSHPRSPPSTPNLPPSQMQMLWNSQIADTCIVFPQWHIHSGLQMALSCVIIALISIGYARLLRHIRTMDRRRLVVSAGEAAVAAAGYTSVPSRQEEGFPALVGRMSLPNLASREPSPMNTPPLYRTPMAGGRSDRRTRVVRAGLYTLTVAISFFVRPPPFLSFSPSPVCGIPS